MCVQSLNSLLQGLKPIFQYAIFSHAHLICPTRIVQSFKQHSRTYNTIDHLVIICTILYNYVQIIHYKVNPMVAISPTHPETIDNVLCKALLNAQQQLGLNRTELGQLIGLDRSSISRLQKRGTLKPNSKAGELATYLIRIYRALYVLMGGDQIAMRHWMETSNRHLQAIPKQLICNTEGLVRVMHYLDAMRGKV